MESLKKEARYEVEPFKQPVLTDVYVDENGTIKFAYNKEDEDWWTPEDGATSRFFISEADAIAHSRSFFPSDMEKVKNYLKHLYFEDEEKLKDILPEAIWNGYNADSKYLTYIEKEILFNAVKGNLNINATTFRISEISHIKHIRKDGDRQFRIVLKDGTKVDTQSRIEYDIIRCLFGDNNSNMSYTL